MRILRDPQKFQSAIEKLRRRQKQIGFVPTMGALHEGHLSLIRAARRENKRVVVSIFVNPLQFGPKEDFKKYPRALKADQKLLAKEKVDLLFCPSVQAMYPKGESFKVVAPKDLKNCLCGKFRSGHFDGVTTIVAKLFNLARPDRVYFGAKDYQQAIILERMIQDFGFGCKMRIMPTHREKDGLAMSSRNAYLSPAQRRRAVGISETLFWMRREVKKKADKDLIKLKRQALTKLRAKVGKVQYLEIVDPKTLKPLQRIQPKMVALAACFVGKTRLIDNVIMSP